MKNYLHFVLLSVLVLLIILCCHGCGLIKIPMALLKEEERLSKTNFLVDIPFVYDRHNYFNVTCHINGKERNLIVDTKAIGLMRDDDIKAYGGVYLAKSPIPTKNSSGQKAKLDFYRLPDFRIDTLSLLAVFGSVKKDYRLYPIIYNGVIGHNQLNLCIWKFSVDNKRVRLFSNSDTARLNMESHDFIRINKGLKDNGIKIKIGSLEKDAKFTLDLGMAGEMLVNRETFTALKKKYTYKTIRTLSFRNNEGVLYLFENIDITWNGIKIKNCYLGYNPNFAFKDNFIGAVLMHRFNFILDSQRDYLFIQPSKNFEQIKPQPVISSFGLNIMERNHRFIIYNIEQGGIAEKAGIELGDELLGVDNCIFNPEYIEKEFIDYAQDKKEITIRIKDKGEVRLSMDNYAKL